MIYGFARQSGGQVRIYSEVGQGTTVCIYLPRHHGDAGTEDAAVATPARRSPQPSDGETVLVVDDEPTVRMLVVEVLDGSWAIAAIEAADGPSGWSMLHSDARIDLLITDVGLPGGMNGRQVADAARMAPSRPQGAVHHRLCRESTIGHGHLDQGMSIMTKPFQLDMLAPQESAKSWRA